MLCKLLRITAMTMILLHQLQCFTEFVTSGSFVETTVKELVKRSFAGSSLPYKPPGMAKTGLK
jgi:hypothetical protein